MDTCLQELTHNPEWEGDTVLVTQLRLCRTLELVPLSLKERRGPTVSVGPLALAIRGQIQEIQRNLPLNLQQNSKSFH